MGALITAVNHITLAVRDLARSIEFCRDVLRLRLAATWNAGAFLRPASEGDSVYFLDPDGHQLVASFIHDGTERGAAYAQLIAG